MRVTRASARCPAAWPTAGMVPAPAGGGRPEGPLLGASRSTSTISTGSGSGDRRASTSASCARPPGLSALRGAVWISAAGGGRRTPAGRGR
jgi:hypothetical protein